MTNKQVKFNDYFSCDVRLKTYPATCITDDDGNSVIFCKDAVLNQITEFETCFTDCYDDDEEFKEYFKVTREEFIDRCNKLREIVNSLDIETMYKIVECLPKYKNGSIRSTAIPVYMTGLTKYDGDYSWCRITSIELAIKPYTYKVPVIDVKSVFGPNKKVEKLYIFGFSTDRQYDKADKPVINKDMTYNKLTYKKNSYLPIDSLVPGTIYRDAKDKEYLYIGVCKLVSNYSKYFLRYDEYRDDIDGDFDEYFDNHNELQYVFLTLTDKRKEELRKYSTFEEWVRTFTVKNITKKTKTALVGYSGLGKLLKVSSSFRVTEPVETAFDEDTMYFTIDETHGFDSVPEELIESVKKIANERLIFDIPYKVHIRFKVYKKQARWKYEVRLIDYSSHDITKSIFTTFNKDEAKAFTKEYCKTHKNVFKYDDTKVSSSQACKFLKIHSEIVSVDK